MGVLYEIISRGNRLTLESPPFEFQLEKNGGVASRLLNPDPYRAVQVLGGKFAKHQISLL